MKIPPGQILTNKFPTMTFGSIPQIDLDEWELRIFGSITKEITLKWPDLQKLPKYKLTSAFHCVTQWSKINNWILRYQRFPKQHNGSLLWRVHNQRTIYYIKWKQSCFSLSTWSNSINPWARRSSSINSTWKIRLEKCKMD